jgi:hypothetical protein
MRRAAKVDANHVEIVTEFKMRGCSVLSLAPMGRGVPDLLVAFGGVTWLVEVKGEKGKETEDQQKFALQWTGCRAIVRDKQGVKDTVEIMIAQMVKLRA